MTRYDKVSISLPHDLLLLARGSHLQQPDETLSAFFARLLREALERRDQQADALYPPAPEQEAVSTAFLHASTDAMRENLIEPPTKRRRRARVG